MYATNHPKGTRGGNFQGDIVRGQLFLGYFSGSNHPEGKYPGGNILEGNCPDIFLTKIITLI